MSSMNAEEEHIFWEEVSSKKKTFNIFRRNYKVRLLLACSNLWFIFCLYIYKE